ncbi:MAG: HEAT repeat domain-containing protein [Chloroflexota bacterium]
MQNISQKSIPLLISKLTSAIAAATRGRDVRRYVERREELMDELVSRGPAAVEPLLLLLRTRHDDVVEYAATVLGRIGAAEAVIPLAHVLAEPYPQQTKRAAARALTMINTPEAVLAVNIWRSRVAKTRDHLEAIVQQRPVDSDDLQNCLAALAEQHQVGPGRVANAYLLLTSEQNLSSDALIRLNALRLTPQECAMIENAVG